MGFTVNPECPNVSAEPGSITFATVKTKSMRFTMKNLPAPRLFLGLCPLAGLSYGL
jgi:hypothetical protein